MNIKLIICVLFFPYLCISQEGRFDKITEESCSCIEQLQIKNLELNLLNREVETCLIGNILDQIDKYGDEVDLDSLLHEEYDVTRFIRSKYEMLSYSLNASCSHYNEILNILMKADLQGREIYQEKGVIQKIEGNQVLVLKLKHGQKVDFHFDTRIYSSFNLARHDQAIGKKVTIKYWEAEYYNPKSRSYYYVKHVSSIIWKDRFIPIFNRINNKNLVIEYLYHLEGLDSSTYIVDLYEADEYDTPYRKLSHLKVIQEKGEKEMYSIYQSSNGAAYDFFTIPEHVAKYDAQPYQIEVSRKNGVISLEEIQIPSKAMANYRDIDYKKRRCDLGGQRPDQLIERVLSYYASLPNYLDFLKEERDYLIFRNSLESSLATLKKLEPLLSSQGVCCNCTEQLRKNISQKTAEINIQNARLLNLDTITFQYYAPYFGVRTAYLPAESNPNEKKFVQQYRSDYQDEWQSVNYVKVTRKQLNANRYLYEIHCRELYGAKRNRRYQPISLTYLYDEQNHTISEQDAGAVWFSSDIYHSIARKLELKYESEKTEDQIVARIVALFLSYQQWDKYLSYLKVMKDLSQQGLLDSKEFYLHDKMSASISDAFKSLYLPDQQLNINHKIETN